MIHRIAEYLTQWCGTVLGLSQEDKEIIGYGTEVFLDGLLKIFALLLIGVFLNKTTEMILVLVSFCSLRGWAGGFHCKTSLGCFISMLLFSLFSILVAPCLTETSRLWEIFAFLFSYIILFLYAPGQTKKNPISSLSLLRKKKIGAILWVTLEFCVVYSLNNVEWKWILIISILFEIFSIVPCRKIGREQRRILS